MRCRPGPENRASPHAAWLGAPPQLGGIYCRGSRASFSAPAPSRPANLSAHWPWRSLPGPFLAERGPGVAAGRPGGAPPQMPQALGRSCRAVKGGPNWSASTKNSRILASAANAGSIGCTTTTATMREARRLQPGSRLNAMLGLSSQGQSGRTHQTNGMIATAKTLSVRVLIDDWTRHVR